MTSADLFFHILQTSFAVSVLIGLVLLVRRPFIKAFGASTAYVLWAIPLARLILPPLPADWTLFGIFGFGQIQAEQGSALTVTEPNVFVELGVVSGALPASPIASPEASLWLQIGDVMPPLMLTLVAVWALGALFVFGMLMLRQIATARLIKAEGSAVSPALQAHSMDVCQTIGLKGKAVTVQTSLISSGPLVSGLMRPVVLLPAWFEDDYTLGEQRLAIMHEMMHVKRGDLWALFAASIAIALQWFNPLAWFALRNFRLDQEAACDADVLGLADVSPRHYGATLVKAVRKSGPVAQPVHAASLPLNHALYERLLQMKNPLPTVSQRRAGTLLTASVGALALMMSAGAASNAQTTDLAGASEDEAEVEAKFEVRTIFIEDDEIVETDGAEGESRTRVRVIRRSEHDGGADLGDSHQQGRVMVFSGQDDGGEMSELTREFAEEVRRLHAAEGDHSAEIEALEEEFEAKIEGLVGEGHGDHEVRVMRFEGDAVWTDNGEQGADCTEGESHKRTVIVERDGETEKRVTVLCGANAAGLDGLDIDMDEIMAELRADGQLSAEQLADVEVKLAEAREKLTAAGVRLDELDFDFEFDFDEDGAEAEIDIEED